MYGLLLEFLVLLFLLLFVLSMLFCFFVLLFYDNVFIIKLYEGMIWWFRIMMMKLTVMILCSDKSQGV